MNFFKRPHLLRRFSKPQNVQGYMTIPYTDMTLPMDVQTMEDKVRTTEDGSDSVQRLKVFCDFEIYPENGNKQQKADRLWFQNKWFDCQSSRLSENTPLRHWTATFVECLDQDDEAEADGGSPEEDDDEP